MFIIIVIIISIIVLVLVGHNNNTKDNNNNIKVVQNKDIIYKLLIDCIILIDVMLVIFIKCVFRFYVL